MVDPEGKFGEFRKVGGAEAEHEVAVDGVERVPKVQK